MFGTMGFSAALQRIVCGAFILTAAGAHAERFFVEPRSIPQLEKYENLRHVADFTGDGRTDLLLVGYDGIYVVPGKRGDGFAEPLRAAAVSPRLTVTDVADFNGDGALDLFCSAGSSWERPSQSIRYGDGRGHFAPPLALDLPPQPYSAADLDGDGRADLVAVDARADTVRFYRSGLSRTAIESPAAFEDESVHDRTLADFDGDGRTDIAIAQAKSVSILWNVGGGRFELGRYDISVTRISAGDADVDGVADIAGQIGSAANAKTAVFYGERHRATFGTRVARSDLSPAGRVAVIARNGTADVLVQTQYGVAVLRARRNRTLGAPALYATGREPLTAIADLDDDGFADLVYQTTWVPANGDGTFQASPAIDLCRLAACGIEEWLMDVNGDGIGDFVIYGNRTLTVLLATAPERSRRLSVPAPKSLTERSSSSFLSAT